KTGIIGKPIRPEVQNCKPNVDIGKLGIIGKPIRPEVQNCKPNVDIGKLGIIGKPIRPEVQNCKPNVDIVYPKAEAQGQTKRQKLATPLPQWRTSNGDKGREQIDPKAEAQGQTKRQKLATPLPQWRTSNGDKGREQIADQNLNGIKMGLETDPNGVRLRFTTETSTNWHEALNSNPELDIHAVFVDFSRAFDTINHGQLLLTLADFGVRRDLWLSVRSYLEGRSQRVKWGSCLSKPHDVLAGVPQGGLLSPLLFVICINSLDTCLPSSVLPVKYADDLTNSEFLMGSLPGQTQRALDAITEWSVPFSLATNGGKTKDMIVSARRKENVPVPPHPTVDGKQIERVVTFKLLGVQISADLTWDAHVQYMLSKTRPRIYYLAAARKAGLSTDVLTQIYVSFIRPILEYASPVWGGLPKRLAYTLEGVQRRCCRIMGISPNSLPTLASRRDQATLRVFRRKLGIIGKPIRPEVQNCKPNVDIPRQDVAVCHDPSQDKTLLSALTLAKVQDAAVCHNPSQDKTSLPAPRQDAAACHNPTQDAAACRNPTQDAAVCHNPTQDAAVCHTLLKTLPVITLLKTLLSPITLLKTLLPAIPYSRRCCLSSSYSRCCCLP
ncbi:hypothetical protein Bbelb_340020, partial [Branchiostoma belcheri]